MESSYPREIGIFLVQLLAAFWLAHADIVGCRIKFSEYKIRPPPDMQSVTKL